MTYIGIRKIILILFSFAIFFSCTSTDPAVDDEPTVYDRDGRIKEQIDLLLDEENPTEALQMIYFYKDKDQNPVEGLNYTELEEQALLNMKGLLTDSVTSRDYRKALSLLYSLSTLNRKDLVDTGLDSTQIKAEYIKNLLEFEKTGAAASMISLGFIKAEDLSDADLEYLANRFHRGENKKALSLIVDEQIKRGLTPLEEVQDFLEQSVGMEDLLQGTVTVWVDKGLRLDRGVGYPDRSIGSGFFIDKAGYILTNYHVIESEVNPEYKGYSRLFIKLSDERGEKIPARVVGWDRHFDIALLKTEIEAPYVFSFSGADQFKLGEQIFAIGSPGGLNNTITSGTVSAVGRQLQTMGESIQIDVPINPGNSGGPLMNRDSEVNGIVFAGITGFEGVNFAIDGEYVKKLLPSLYEGGALTHSWIGIGGYQSFKGLEVLYVMPDSPAGKLGLQRGDSILSVNGESVSKNQHVRDKLLGMVPGTLIELEWKSGDTVKKSTVAVAERPDIPFEEAVKKDTRENLIPPLFGMVLSQVSKSQYTVQKVYTGGAADEASISANDVIILRKWQVNEKDGYVLIQFVFKGVKAGYLESAVQLGAGLESAIFF
ncbi:S1C family serine protease [Oceanispirochaeta crateris]|nr:trypsin-like peptidase domain-containing protein [Oceanispirochaeta crateris]